MVLWQTLLFMYKIGIRRTYLCSYCIEIYTEPWGRTSISGFRKEVTRWTWSKSKTAHHIYYYVNLVFEPNTCKYLYHSKEIITNYITAVRITTASWKHATTAIKTEVQTLWVSYSIPGNIYPKEISSAYARNYMHENGRATGVSGDGESEAT